MVTEPPTAEACGSVSHSLAKILMVTEHKAPTQVTELGHSLAKILMVTELLKFLKMSSSSHSLAKILMVTEPQIYYHNRIYLIHGLNSELLGIFSRTVYLIDVVSY